MNGVEMVEAPADLEQQVPAFLGWARMLRVTTPDVYADAAQRLLEIKGAAKRVSEFFGPMKRAQDQAKKTILDRERTLAAPLAEAEALTKRALVTYREAEEAKRLAEQRKLQAEADARARREREGLEKKAAAAVRPETKERYQEEAANVAAPVVSVAAPAKTPGVTSRLVWRARVVDPLKVPREFLEINERKLDGYAKAMKEGANVPGVEFFTETVLAASGR